MSSEVVESKFFHSIIVEGKKEFLKKLCLILKQGMLSTFLVTCTVCICYNAFLSNNFVLIYLLIGVVVFGVGSVYSVIDYQI